ncbi:hypothetical protein [Capnocytophaga granulosa]|jgi:hypothetical protein|uniref:hypothetical protein n=2 Tax=Capnocytophaga granulosa TaxID=45242 RepID=UPI0023F23A90|nr:hypothetical protein [Capnocytophaga granulosa]
MEKHCCICNRKEEKSFLGLTSNMRTCKWCNKNCCSNCIKNVSENIFLMSRERDLLQDLNRKYCVKNLCPNCYNLYIGDYEKMENAINNNEDVRYFSKNYLGKINFVGETFTLETKFHEDRDDAMEELRIFAKFYGCNCIIKGEFYWEEREDEKENERGRVYKYRYKVWACSGIAVNRVENKF